MIFFGPAEQTVKVVANGKRMVVLFPDLSESEVQTMLEEVPTRIWWHLERIRKNIPARDLRRWCAAAEYLGCGAEKLWDEAVAAAI